MNNLNVLMFKFFNLILCINFCFPCCSIAEEDNSGFTTLATGEGIQFESPQWSAEENALYWTDGFGQKLYRWDEETGNITSKCFDYGYIGFLIPVRDYPGFLLVAVRTELFVRTEYLLDWNAPEGEEALRLLTGVDFGRPDNVIDDGKADANGNVWFGTFGNPQKFLAGNPELDTATFYMVNYNNFRNPEIKIRPVSISNGITWSKDNKRMFYNDSPTRKVVGFDFDLENSEIGNMTTVFDLAENGIDSLPDGMTSDADDNLYVAAFDVAKILIINSKTGELLDTISLPVDHVTSLVWGGRDYTTLFVTTAALYEENPKPLSGSVFILKNAGRGKPEFTFKFPNADQY